MRLSVRDVLGLPVLADADVELVTGERALDNPVRWVHVSELLEVAALLSGGELLLSTGLMIGADVDAAAQHLRRLHEAGAAGVIVELPPGREPTCTALRRAAVDAQLPVAILHRQTRFVDVTEAVHRLIVADQLEQLEAARQIHELFTDLALRGAAPERVVAAAAELLHAGVILEDPSNRVVALGSAPRTASSRALRPPVGGTIGQDDGTEVVGGVGAGVGAVVFVRDVAWGRVRVPGRADSTALHVAERAAQAITLHLMAERDDRDMAASAQSTFLADVLTGDLTDQEMDERAATLGLVTGGEIVPLAVRWSSPTTPLDATRRERSVRDVLSAAVRRAGASALTGHVGPDAMAVLLAAPAEARVDAVVGKIAAAVAEAHRDVPVRARPWIGAGPSSSTVRDAAAGLAEAAHVASAAVGLGEATRTWFRAVDVRLPGLITMLVDEPRVAAFARAELGPLVRPERRDDLSVVRALVRAGGAKSAAAAALFLSRPALYHRIGRLERELGVSLTAPDSLLSLGVALQVYDTAAIGQP